MNTERTNQLTPAALYLIVGACVVIIIAGLKLSSELVAPLLFAFTLTLLVWPIIQWLQKKGLPKWLAILLVSASVLTSVVLLIFIFLQSLQQLSVKLPEYSNRLSEQVKPLEGLVNYMSNGSISTQQQGFDPTPVLRTIINFFIQFIGNIFNVGIFLFSLLLMILASDSFVRKFRNYFKNDKVFLTEFNGWSKNIQDQYRVQTISNLLSGTITTILFLILRIDFALLWGALTFLLAYIPNIGIIMASIAPVVLAFILFGWQTALLIILLIVLLNFIMDNIVTPRLMGQQLKVPLIVVFLSFTFWTWVFGPIGAFISLPITLGIRALLSQSKNTEFTASLLAADEENANIKK